MMAFLSAVTLILGFLSTLALAQQPGTLQPEVHPTLYTQECDDSGCVSVKGSAVLDANWRWTQKGGMNCFTNENAWDPSLCPDGKVCAQQCCLEGVDYEKTYGVSTTPDKDGLILKYVTKGTYGSSVGSRLYLLEDEHTYKLFKLKNREFTFEVDVSSITCGLNGALYFVEMSSTGDFDGANNGAGAKYGTGYCDAQCPHDIKFIKGEANVMGWNSSTSTGHYGTCCAEMDIWEANRRATAYTPHPCSEPGLTKCEGIACGDNDKGERYDGICDKDGCDFNPFRMGNESFYGFGSDYTVDTSKPITVVTQFITNDGTDAGNLTEIKRFYVQDGEVIPNSEATLLGSEGGDSITDEFCDAQKTLFGDVNDFAKKGGMTEMGEALDRGMVLAMSFWDDTSVNMLWLDSKYPTTELATTPGVMRGPCPGGHTSTPEYLRRTTPDSGVTYSHIKVGTIGSTFASNSRRMSSVFA